LPNLKRSRDAETNAEIPLLNDKDRLLIAVCAPGAKCAIYDGLVLCFRLDCHNMTPIFCFPCKYMAAACRCCVCPSIIQRLAANSSDVHGGYFTHTHTRPTAGRLSQCVRVVSVIKNEQCCTTRQDRLRIARRINRSRLNTTQFKRTQDDIK